MAKMRVEFIEDYKHEGQDYSKEDRITVDAEVGEFFCRAGVCKDLDGNVETAPRDVNRVVTLDVQSASSNETARVKQ